MLCILIVLSLDGTSLILPNYTKSPKLPLLPTTRTALHYSMTFSSDYTLQIPESLDQ